MRLDKYVSLTGPSRKQARGLILTGRVAVNGAVSRDCALSVSIDDRVTLDGEMLGAKSELYLMVHKPAGMLTATEDAHGQPTVIDLLPDALKKRGPGPVGRLDKDVTGLVLMTTDGQLAHRLISPKRHVEKVYRAVVSGTPDEGDAARFAAGLPLSDFTAMPARLTVIAPGNEALCEVVVTEGKFHQVKRMFAAVGHPVLRLSRLSIGGVSLDAALAEGQWRELTEDEVERLKGL